MTAVCPCCKRPSSSKPHVAASLVRCQRTRCAGRFRSLCSRTTSHTCGGNGEQHEVKAGAR